MSAPVQGMKVGAGRNPRQFAQDVEEIVEAAELGGRRLGNLVYRSIVQARALTGAEAVMLAGRVKRMLSLHGTLHFAQERK